MLFYFIQIKMSEKEDQKKTETWPREQSSNGLKESKTSLFEAVKDAKTEKTIYPENQISPALSSFENRLIKQRESEFNQ